jgi:hypothetical protein
MGRLQGVIWFMRLKQFIAIVAVQKCQMPHDENTRHAVNVTGNNTKRDQNTRSLFNCKHKNTKQIQHLY